MADLFTEMKQYVRFGGEDEAALRALGPHATPHFQRIADEFYQRLVEHEDAARVITDAEQVARLKCTLGDWMAQLFTGPWDEVYYHKRARIGRVHVRIGLAQRYMFGAMNLIRIALVQIAQETYRGDEPARLRAVWALTKIFDLELCIMMETYREAFVEEVQLLEQQEKLLLHERLAMTEARYQEIVEKGEALIAVCDADGALLLFNRRCEEVTGMERASALGKGWSEVFAGAPEQAGVARLRAAALAGERASAFEGTVRRGDGTERRVRWHMTTLPSASGPLLCSIGLDVTEERALETRTRRAERLASLGTMAAGLAHEIRNPLNAAHLQLTLLQRRLGRSTGADVDGARHAAELVEGEMKRLAALVEEFLQFAKPQPLRLQRGDLRVLANEVLQLLGPEATAAGVDLAVEAGPPVRAEVDEERMKQVLINLFRNALEATGRGGRVRVEAASDDGEAHLAVADDGPGLPSPDAPIFEPFYTTKEGGTGLGLAIVHRIVSDHGGRVAVESRPGRTVFTVVLPAN